MLAVHVLAVVVGMGAATVADLLFFSFLRDFSISKKEASVLHTLARVVVVAIVIVILTGIALFAAEPAVYATSPHFIAKMTIVAIVACNGVALHIWVAPRMVQISFRGAAAARLVALRRLAFVLGPISVVSWYAAFFIAMLKASVLQGATLAMLLGAYVALLVCGIIAGQMLERSLALQARPRR